MTNNERNKKKRKITSLIKKIRVDWVEWKTIK